jgi:hypothetical protein
MTGDDALNEFFANKRTTLKDIKDAGWTTYGSSSGRWWWEKIEEGKPKQRQVIPLWVEELLQVYYDRGVRDTQNAINRALGLEELK